MTDNLTTKFSGFETLVTDNHTELIALLNSIAETIGAPPVGPTTTLSDVVAAITAGNAILTGIRSDQAAQAAALQASVDALYANSELIIVNSATNTKELLQAIYATFCDCTTATAIEQPPLIVSPTPLADDEKCRRVQFYISVFTTWLTKIANYTATGASLTAGVLDSLLGLAAAEAGIVATGAEVGTVGGVPGIVIASAIAAISGAVYLLGSAYLNDILADFQSPIFQNALLTAMYAADNASEGQAAFEATMGPYFDAIPGGILSALWWSQWSNDMYSDTPVVDTSAFDGSICIPPTPGECVSWPPATMDTVITSHGDRIRPSGEMYDLTPADVGDGTMSGFLGDWNGWTYTMTGKGMQSFYAESGGALVFIDNTDPGTTLTYAGTIPAGTAPYIILFQSYIEEFTLELCPPEE